MVFNVWPGVAGGRGLAKAQAAWERLAGFQTGAEGYFCRNEMGVT